MAFHTDIDLCGYLWFQAACLPANPFFDPTAVPDGGTSFVRFALPFAFRFVRSVSGGQLSSFFLMTAVSGGMTSFVRFACPFAFRFVRRVLGGLLSSCYPLVLVSYCVFRRRGFVRSFRVSFAFRFVRSVLGGLLSSCSFLSSSCPILGPKSSGGTCLFLSLYGGVFFLASVDNVKIVPYATPICDVLQFFCLVKFKQDPENVSPYTIQT